MLKFYKVARTAADSFADPVEIREDAFPAALWGQPPHFSFRPSETVRDLARAFAIHCTGKLPPGDGSVYWCVSRTANRADGWVA
jgi:hypothetical protein